MKEIKLSVIGLGYVGMPLAVAFAKNFPVVGFDINDRKVREYIKGIDITNEVGDEAIKNSTVDFTWEEEKLKSCNFHVVAVPTPTNVDKTPDLRPLIGASEILGRNLSKGSIVVYESTVYPGVTEEICQPILEKMSGLKCGVDFKIGYSPERINPGDKVHKLENIVKIVSGMDEETLKIIAEVYGTIIEAGVYEAENIKVAEAAKLIENCQRDLNISFFNELAMIFNKMDIDTRAVIEAAGSKWNFIKMNPGLVGGHCIGVDPFYLIQKAKEVGVESKVIAAGRNINDSIPKFIAENTVKSLIKANKRVKGAKIAVLGITFKEDCPDIRNTKVIDVINELKEYQMEVMVTDPVASKEEVEQEYGVELLNLHDINGVDAIVLAVSHSAYRKMELQQLMDLFSYNTSLDEIAATAIKGEKNVIVDIKGILNKGQVAKENFIYWRF